MPSEFNLSAFLPYRLAVLSEQVSRRLAAEYGRSHDLSVAEWRVLAHLLGSGAVSVRDIRGRVNLEKPRVSRAVSRLERFGLVNKAPGDVDGRLVAISLTDRGRAVLDEIIPEVLGVQRTLEEAVGPEELATFFRVMERWHAVLDREQAEMPHQAATLGDRRQGPDRP